MRILLNYIYSCLNMYSCLKSNYHEVRQPALSCSKPTMETPEQCVKHAQNLQLRRRNEVNDVVLMSLLLTLNRFRSFF